MSLFHKKSHAPLVFGIVVGSVATIALAAYGVLRWMQATAQIDDDDITDFSDPYIPAPARAGSRRAVHGTV